MSKKPSIDIEAQLVQIAEAETRAIPPEFLERLEKMPEWIEHARLATPGYGQAIMTFLQTAAMLGFYQGYLAGKKETTHE